jgi:hypothetical protein
VIPEDGFVACGGACEGEGEEGEGEELEEEGDLGDEALPGGASEEVAAGGGPEPGGGDGDALALDLEDVEGDQRGERGEEPEAPGILQLEGELHPTSRGSPERTATRRTRGNGRRMAGEERSTGASDAPSEA